MTVTMDESVRAKRAEFASQGDRLTQFKGIIHNNQSTWRSSHKYPQTPSMTTGRKPQSALTLC